MAKKESKIGENTQKTVQKTVKTVSIVKKKRKIAPKTRIRRVVSLRGKAEESEPIIKIPQTYLTSEELTHFKSLLVKKYGQIVGDVNHLENDAMRKSRQDAAGDLSCMPIHMADIGSDNFEQEFSLGLMDNERQIANEIMMALRRIDDGTYGMCEGTGEPIPKARLEACPWVRYCVRYAEMIEKKQVTEVRNNNYSNGGAF